MIPPDWRFWAASGDLMPLGPHTWHIIDWDQRRWFQVTGSANAFPHDDDDAIKFLSKHIDDLGPDVRAINVSDDGDLISVSTKPEDDYTWAMHYPRLPDHLPESETSTREHLIEVDRLGPCVDLVRHKKGAVPTAEAGGLKVFKYPIIWQHKQKIWDEIHIVKGLKGHPSIAAFDRIIMDDVEPRVLGLTVDYIPNGTLDENRTRPFRFSWLRQLTSVIDDLNLKFGIVHQDIAARNIAIDPTTDRLKLFDFDRAARIGSPQERPGRNDVDGASFTLYEILTEDEQYREVPFHEQDVHRVEALVEWPLKAPLEEAQGGVPAYRQYLEQWTSARRTTRTIKHHSEAAEPLDWPALPPETPIPFEVPSDDGTGGKRVKMGMRWRYQALANGQHVVSWERSPQKPGHNGHC